MTTRRRWTKEEDEVILSHVSKKSDNITEALSLAAEQIGRTYRACNIRYYRELTSAARSNKNNSVFITSGFSEHMTNRKVTRGGARAIKQSPVVHRESKWKRIIRILFE